MYIMLDSMCVTMSMSTGLYPNLDLLNANKLHYITERVEIECNVRGQLNMTKLTKHVVYFLQNLSGYLIVAPQI